ncbi:MAG: tRNA pseudouridine(38-40) synthase TruA [Gammaproteobacteria bacterium]|jgi:tRNA pseudouridine38-40 synthase|nr:tRNA pseudouridine(38-40) synthase TruA [Chromatiales bacterium]MDP6675865.1 tRNA pseudouridine(38-40) synthase TruA [Gammaproteobacteria bacterium]
MENQRRLAMGVEYDGTLYHGWQYQPHAASIQECLNAAISVVADEATTCIGSGRTDTGVHAVGQVVHFETRAERSPRSWLLGINSNLPDDINVNWVKGVDAEFHARYSAIKRAYRYTILNRPVRSALARNRAWWVRQPLDESAMAVSVECLLGLHDFSSFRAAGCQSHSPLRDMIRIDVMRKRDWIFVDCEANAFLHHMVRNILGSLVEIGRGERPVEWLQTLLAARDRKLAGITAPAAGLVLTQIQYPVYFGLDDMISSVL